MHDRIVVQNVSAAPVVHSSLRSRWRATSRDIFAVKEHDFSFGDPIDAKPLPDPVEPRLDAGALLLVDAAPGGATTHIHFSELGDVDGGVVRYRLELDPRERWELATVVNPRTNGRAPAPQASKSSPGRRSSRGWRRRGTHCTTRSSAPSTTLPRCECGGGNAGTRGCRRRACRGS